MACESCCPDYYDHGFDLPDCRATYYVPDPEDEDAGTTVQIIIRRVWKDCECGEGTDYDCWFDVVADGHREATFRTQHEAHDHVDATYPSMTDY